MYESLLQIKSPKTRVEMIQTILSSPEHVKAAKEAGLYSHLLHYIQVVSNGGHSSLPGEQGQIENPGRQENLPLPQITSQKRGTSSGSVSSTVALRGGAATMNKKGKEANEKGNEKALNYFAACLRILDLEEEVALSQEALKKAYKKAVVRAHPDKGGSEKEFEAVTRAYGYLGEILMRIHGGRGTSGKVDAPTQLASGRKEDAKGWMHAEPVRLNPDKLDLKSFNDMYEKTRIPDPEESGYGDWLSNETNTPSSTQKFGGKFNRDVFNKAFEGEMKSSDRQKNNGQIANVLQPEEMSLASRMGFGVALGRTGKDDYTVAPNEQGLKYTDLKKAYTEYNTFSQQTSGVEIANRSLSQFTEDRKKAPTPLRDYELEALKAAEDSVKRGEDARRMRVAQEAIQENDYFERMKRLVIRNN